MTAPARFLFETDFSRPNPAEEDVQAAEETADAPIATYLKALAAAEARAYAQGQADGRKQVEAQSAKRLADNAGLLVSSAQGILAALDADRARIEKDAADLALTTARRLAEHLIARQPSGEVVALVDQCLGPLRQAPHIVVRVNEAHVEAIKSEADRISHERGFSGRLVILGEPDLRGGDCRIEWADGGIVRDRTLIEQQIDAAIESYFAARDADANNDGAQAQGPGPAAAPMENM